MRDTQERAPGVIVRRSVVARPNAEPDIPKVPHVFLFSDFSDKEPVYVGQTRNLRTRLRNHTGAKATENQASFAYLIGKVKAEAAGVDLNRTRKVLEADPHFSSHFRRAKERVATMNVRWIELDDPIERKPCSRCMPHLRWIRSLSIRSRPTDEPHPYRAREDDHL